jgi:hypothetical protein
MSPAQEVDSHLLFSLKYEQEPAPSHNPVVPQGEDDRESHIGSAMFSSMNLQRPAEPVWLQDWQACLHSMLQHTPSVQKPETHSSSTSHGNPLSFFPHEPFEHCWPAAHSALVEQLDVHWPSDRSQV